MHHSLASAIPAPPLQVALWLNAPTPIDLASLRGKVVLLHAFQMLCPGCVMHGLPQAEKAHRLFAREDFAVVGLHTVFEHHSVMGVDALKAFVHEYRWSFPIGIDRADEHGDVPLTMRAYGLQGTPSIVLLDRLGRVRLQHLGQFDDLALGRIIGQLLAEVRPASGDDDAGCDRGVCTVR